MYQNQRMPTGRARRAAAAQHWHFPAPVAPLVPAAACFLHHVTLFAVHCTAVLYIRPDAVFDKSKPISGGIPHCFPQVGAGGPACCNTLVFRGC
jgi:hypothetical protein